MAATVVGFRTAFPEFFDVTVYGDARIQMWIDFAAVRLDPDRWGGLLDRRYESSGDSGIIATRTRG